MNIESKIKKWIESVQKEQLESVIEDIQEIVSTNISGRANKYIFKLLLYLSHTADKCDKDNKDIGKEIYRLTCLLCSVLIEVPDSNKYVSSLYHIIRCLLEMFMFKEAFKICVYLKEEHYARDTVNDVLIKISHLWYDAVRCVLDCLQDEPSYFENYHVLKNIIRYELEMIQIAHKNFTKYFLMKISSYLNEILSIKQEPNIYFTDFYTFIVEYISETELVLNMDEKYVISRHVFHITSKIICENINEKCLNSVTNIVNTISKHFKTMLLKDEECYQCFLLLESICLILLKPVEYLEECTVKNIQNFCDNYLEIVKKFGYIGSLKWATFSIIQILESLFMYWEICVKTEKKTFLKNDILLQVMNMISHVSICFIKQISDKCKSCQNENCTIKRDMYNAVVTKIRCVNLISKFSADDLSKDICVLAQKFLEQNVADIYEMKKNECKCWTQLWSTCSAMIYNLCIKFDRFYEESVSLCSLLCTSIIQFEDVQSKSRYINLKNPLCSALYRLSSIHYNQGMYREAMTVTALNALLSYNDTDSKAFRMWANIKHKSITSKEVVEMTIVTCLKKDKGRIKELGLSEELSKHDLIEVCLREVADLQEARVNLSDAIRKVLNEMKALKATPIQYARAVQMLVCHLLNFDYNEDISECLKQGISSLKQIKGNNFVLCLQANLEFYIFINQLSAVNKQTQTEMENSKFALHAPKVSEIGENESRDVVPAYTMINIKEDSKLLSYLQKPLKKWSKCFQQNIEEVAYGYEPLMTLRTLITAGEYAHLHRYQDCEINIWKLAYALASELKNNYAIIYVIGRSISVRHIDYEWINTGKKLANELDDSQDKDIIYAIAIFWISLSDFYFECNMYSEARELLNKSRKLPGISFFSNIAVYLYSLDRILYNCYLYEESIKHEEYTRYIIETLYTMVNLNEELSTRKWKPQDKYLFGFDILLSATVNLSPRMNSLLSFREIGGHLVRRLKTAQTLGAVARVAEILKAFCYIDLSRSQLSDCEVKLQGLEHILNIETFKASMNSNSAKLLSENVLLTPVRVVDPIRDIPQNDASPILRNKVFDLPEFMRHKDCNCYICKNVSYHYLVFSSTHIRAQLYALQRNITASLQHFHGAFKIKENLMKLEKRTSKNQNQYISWQERFYSVDYILLLINFTYFLRSYSSSKQEEIINVISLAIQICDMYKLKGHPIYMAVKELMIDYRFQKTFDNSASATFTVPDPADIDISPYVNESRKEANICVTPANNNVRTKKPITLRRNRTPPLLKLTKVSMNFSDDEGSDSSSPPSRHKRTRSHSKLIGRKILDEEYLDNSTKRKESQSSLLSKQINDVKEQNVNNISMKDIVEKVTSVVPDVSEYLYKIVDEIDESATDKSIQKLIDTVENLRIKTASQKYTRKTRLSKQLTSSDCNKIIQTIELFKDLTITDRKDNGKDITAENNESSSCKTTEESNTSKLDQDNSLFLNRSDKIENLKKIQRNESTKLRVTRNLLKRGKSKLEET
ncbi:uncharacterized protein LOC114875210 [Osmia bicornis bicornis]|uniref:uncharacterized protein LOC114875210 n=1 Tax=Osmia bicornis bicornis TaxID=1437191 RepID=UPI001EAF5B1F|nr:uncharacterized protein LOC114875210 [Osmia bicornis bicornis]